jgi:HSP20 family protein
MTMKRNGDLIITPPRQWGEDYFMRDLLNWGLTNYSNTGTSIPSVNIREKKDSFEVEIAAPGMNKNDFSIELDGTMLTITSEKEEKKEHRKDQEKFICREFSYQSFQRSFNLPKEVVDVDRIKAHYEDGLLQLSIPKKETAKQKHPKIISIV